MMNKRILIAGMAAALSISSAGIPAYAATNQDNQMSIEKDSGTKERPEEGKLGRKSDEEAMKEGNPTPELPEGITTDDFDAPMERPEGDDGTQTPPERPEGDDGTQTPPERPEGDDGTQTPPEKPEGDDETQTPPEKPENDNGMQTPPERPEDNGTVSPQGFILTEQAM